MTKTEKEHYDAVIVGSGPGGATVARELSRRKKRVLILEWGSDEPIRGTTWQTLKMATLPGKNALITNGGLLMIRGTTLGGSSTFYYATVFDPPFAMLKSHGIDITDEIREARKELPTDPLRDELVGPLSTRIMESACDLGYQWEKMPKFIFQDKCRINCDKCTLGCPYEAKWTARNYVAEALAGGARLLPRARATKVIVEKGKAIGVEYRHGGKQHQILAPQIIVSAGGIGTPVLLRASGIANAGSDLFYDPLIMVMGTVSDIKTGGEIPMSAGMHLEDEGIMMTDLTIPRILYSAFTAEVMRFDRLLAHSRTLSIMIKIRDRLGGRITDRGGLRKGLSADDRKKLARGEEIARKILKNANATHIFKSWYIAAHPGGTAKIDDVIDRNLKTEYDNLYVCDCSVIPEECGVPPTLTIVSLGKRLAKHLAGETEKPARKKTKKSSVS